MDCGVQILVFITAALIYILNRNGMSQVFTVEGTQLLRFLADVYGHAAIDQLEVKERTASAPFPV